MQTNKYVLAMMAMLIVCVGVLGMSLAKVSAVQRTALENMTVIRDSLDLTKQHMEAVRFAAEFAKERDNIIRTMAYHQAVAQVEQEYPEAYRSALAPDEWIEMLEKRQNEILQDINREFSRSY